jgi:hypothetical protein
MSVKGLYLFILFVFPVPQSTIIRSGASVPRAWRRWRQSKGRSPGFSALCQVSSSSSFYLSRHQILLVPTFTTYHRVAYLLLSSFVRSFVSRYGRLRAVDLDLFCLAVGPGARLCSPPRQTQNRCCVLPHCKGVYWTGISSSEFVLPLRRDFGLRFRNSSAYRVFDRHTTRQVSGFI